MLLTYYEATRSQGSRQVDCNCYIRSCYHIIPEKWFLLYWMCDFIALTRCCKLISFLHLIFAVLLPNLIRPIVCQIF